MSNEIQIDLGQTGKALYALVFNRAGAVWNGAAFVTPLAVNWGTYAIAMSEQSTTGFYSGNFPVVVADVYGISIRNRAGVSAATTDIQIGSGPFYWDGAAEVSNAAIKAKTDQLTFTVLNKVDATVAALSPTERTEIVNALLDAADAIETGLTVRQALRLMSATLFGVVTGAGTNTVQFRAAITNIKARVIAFTDRFGNRTNITTDST